MAEGGTPPRMVAECTVEDRDEVKRRAIEHGYDRYGAFLVDIGKFGVLPSPVVRQVVEQHAAAEGRSYSEQVMTMLIAGAKALHDG